MLKRLLRISGYRGQKSEVRLSEDRSSEVRSQIIRSQTFIWKIFNSFRVCSLFSVLCLLFTVSCAPKHIEMPSYEGIPIENVLSELKNIQLMEAVLSVEYEKNDSAMSGDASLNLSENGLNLRLYYLGFLVGEVSEENGIVKSMPKIDKNKSTILVDGLKNSFFWWDIEDYTLQEKEDVYELKNSYRKILISKKTLLPVQQTIELNDGEELKIFYDVPAKIDSNELSAPPLWYQSRLKIEFRNYVVKIKVKSYSVVR